MQGLHNLRFNEALRKALQNIQEGADVDEIAVELITESKNQKLVVKAGPGVSEEDRKTGEDALRLYFAKKTQMMDPTDPLLGRAAARYDYVVKEVIPRYDESTINYGYTAKGSKVRKKKFEWSRSLDHIFKTPSDAVKEIEAEPNTAYRGMSYEEWQNIKKIGFVRSKGSYNMENQTNLTFFSDRPETAKSYATFFAPEMHTLSKKKPGVIIAISARGLLTHKDDPQKIPRDELASNKPVPIKDIKRIWYILPSSSSEGSFDLREYDAERKTVKSGSFMGSTIAYHLIEVPLSKA